MDRDLIDAYVSALRQRLSSRPDVDDVTSEVEDHLREHVARLEGVGVSSEVAQQRALACFGDLGLVARSFADRTSRDVAVPTRATRRCGTAALAAAIAWVASILMGAAGGHTDLLTTWSLGRYVVWAALVAAATGLTTVGVAGTFLRAGAARRPSARVAMALGVAATVLLVPGAWAVTAVMALFGVALVVASERLRGPGERFVGPIRLLGVAWPVGITVLLLGNEVFRVGPVDEYGDYPLAWFVPFVTCAACSAAALFTIGRQLRAERPADLTARTLTPATPLGA